MQKWILPSSIALIVTFFLFSFMAFLVKQPSNVTVIKSPAPQVDIFNQQRDTRTNIRPIKSLPTKDSITPPVRKMPVITDNTPATSEKVAFERSLIGDITKGLGAGETVGGGKQPFITGPIDGNASPIVQVQPQYPIEAARKGIEGWVKLSFSIDKTGSVTQIRVLDASPARVFDRQAKNALKRWRYKAKFVNGAPVIQDNLRVQLDFSLDK